MQVTETRRLARRHMKTVNRGNHIFNDKLTDGRRSLKVWGWTLPEYESFQQVLKGAGLRSEIVERPRLRTQPVKYRIHVWE